jgi:hypothetical protein
MCFSLMWGLIYVGIGGGTYIMIWIVILLACVFAVLLVTVPWAVLGVGAVVITLAGIAFVVLLMSGAPWPRKDGT